MTSDRRHTCRLAMTDLVMAKTEGASLSAMGGSKTSLVEWLGARAPATQLMVRTRARRVRPSRASVVRAAVVRSADDSPAAEAAESRRVRPWAGRSQHAQRQLGSASRRAYLAREQPHRRSDVFQRK